MAMELDIIKTDTTWNDAAGSVNKNFSKIKLAIATLVAEGGGLDEEQLAEYLQANGYTTEQWIALQEFIKLGSLDTEIKADSVNAVQNKAIKAYVDKVAHEAEDAAIRGALEGLSADEIYIKYIENKMSLLLAQDGGLGTPDGMQGLGIVSIPSAEIITDALGYEPNKSFIHIQGEASDTWTIEHNMGRYPSVTVVDSAGSAVFGDVSYTNENQLTVTFSVAFSGKAYLN